MIIGIHADYYTPVDSFFETVDVEPTNKCYCPGDEYCPPKGLQNISPCQYSAYLYPFLFLFLIFVSFRAFCVIISHPFHNISAKNKYIKYVAFVIIYRCSSLSILSSFFRGGPKTFSPF